MISNSAQRGGTFLGLLLGLVIGALVGGAIAWSLRVEQPHGTAVVGAPEVETPRTAPGAAPASDDYFSRKLREWNLAPEELKSELDRAGRIVREKGRVLGDKVVEATSDVAIIAKIKAKFVLDEELDAMAITVGCKDGRVTLGGAVPDAALIGRAIVHALDTHGVVDVVSSVKVTISDRPPGSI